MDDNTKDTIQFGLRIMAVIILSVLGVAIPTWLGVI